jgi:hypothetical protein
MKENHDDDGNNQYYIAMESTYLTSSYGQKHSSIICILAQ